MTSSSDRVVNLATLARSDALLTRTQGAELRHALVDLLAEEAAIVIDMKGVRALSPSFADELFGGLDRELKGEFSKRIRIAAASEPWRRLIRSAVGHRRSISVREGRD